MDRTTDNLRVAHLGDIKGAYYLFGNDLFGGILEEFPPITCIFWGF
jgi:hypothetical protein